MYEPDEFDRMIKSTLECGEEEVPDGLWAGIESRLDAGTSAPESPLFSRYRRRRTLAAIFGLAVACAVAVLSLYPGTLSDTTEPIDIADGAEGALAYENITPTDAEASEIVSEDLFLTGESVADWGNVPAAAASSDNGHHASQQFDLRTATDNEDIAGNTSDASDSPTGSGIPDGSENGNAGTAQEPLQKKDMDAVSLTEFRTNAEDILFPDDKTKPGRKRIAVALTANANSGGNIGTNLYSVGFRTIDTQHFGGEKIIETESTSFAPPISVGIGLRFALNKHWSIGTGLIYNYLGRRYNGTYEYAGALDSESIKGIWNSQHYIGIPLNAYYSFAGTEKFDFYIMAGGTVEKCVGETHRFAYYGHNMVFRNSVAGVQFSAGLGLGMQYDFSETVGFYIEPSFRYFFRESHQSRSIRTMQPFEINCELGFRFNLSR